MAQFSGNWGVATTTADIRLYNILQIFLPQYGMVFPWGMGGDSRFQKLKGQSDRDLFSHVAETGGLFMVPDKGPSVSS